MSELHEVIHARKSASGDQAFIFALKVRDGHMIRHALLCPAWPDPALPCRPVSARPGSAVPGLTCPILPCLAILFLPGPALPCRPVDAQGQARTRLYTARMRIV